MSRKTDGQEGVDLTNAQEMLSRKLPVVRDKKMNFQIKKFPFKNWSIEGTYLISFKYFLNNIFTV